VGNAGDLSRVLAYIAELRSDAAVSYCEKRYEETGSAYLKALLSFGHFHLRHYEEATLIAAEAIAEAGTDAEALIVARAAAGLASAAWPVAVPPAAPRPDMLVAALRDLHSLDRVDADSRAFALYLLAEASIACARLDLASQFVERTGALPVDFLSTGALPHPYLAVMYIMQMRVLGFQGRVTEALELGKLARVPAGNAVMTVLLDSTLCFLHGTALTGPTAASLADRLASELPQPIDYVSTGCYLLVAYGLIATGDAARAAEFTLLAGANAGLEALSIIDRALGLEMLTASAVAQLDLDAAEAWREQAEVLLAHPISRPTIERLVSRVELLAGHPVEAAAWAQLSIEHAVVDGRVVEAAEGETLLSQARDALTEAGIAPAVFDSTVAEALGSGAFAARRPAASERRTAGRRLRPESGTGWAGLSPREREVARLITEGHDNQAIAARLHLSQHTVRAHVSRVLAAFGVASRFAVAARLAEVLTTEPTVGSGAALTPRQEAVVDRIVLGRSNDEIARDLGISIKTVEKHVSEVLRRWEVTSRIGIARVALGNSVDRS
jgi:DNA-binding NarL/FixJ family response regulator